jgi:hypothetical protein
VKFFALLALLVSLVGCNRSKEPPPQALTKFLEAVQEERFEDAYQLTQLDDMVDFAGAGAAITLNHFVAAWTIDPLQSYEITEVIALSKRDIEDFGAPDPYYETMVRFVTEATSWTSNIAIEGSIVGTVIVDVFPLKIEGAPRSSEVFVDGVPLEVEVGKDATVDVLTLAGRHSLSFDRQEVIFDAEPLTVVEGPASIPDMDRRTLRLGSS